MARKYLNIYNFENQTFSMKRLLLAPFLIANLFSFCGELKANQDSSSQDGIQPMARSDQWQMLRFVFKYKKNPLWGEDNCTPKNKKKCLKNHRHTGSTGKYAIDYYSGTDQGPMVFDSSSACTNAANNLKNFYGTIPETYNFNHHHEVKGEGGEHYHTHRANQLQKFDFKYFCFQSSSVDFDATELKDTWYMKSIIMDKSRYPSRWGNSDCKPKHKNGNCKNNHSHNTSSTTTYLDANLYQGLYFGRFDSYAKCILAGSQINSFLRNLSLTGSLQHNHSSGSKDNFAHNHPIENRHNLSLRYNCIKAKGY